MNKISRRNFLKVAGAGAAAMGLAACGGSSSSSSSVAASSTAANAAADTLSGTIEYWSSWSETENQALVLKQAADAFTQLHPNVKINFTFNGRDNRNLVVSAIEAGTQIDLMDANIDNVQKLWSENIKDLSSYIDKTYDTTNGKAYKDVVIPSMISLAGSLFDGKTMCIPYIPQAFMIFCNKGLLEECGVTEYPQTWEELMDACEKVKAAGHIPVTTDSNYCTSWVGYYMSRRLGNDRVMELAKDSSQWASEQGVKDTAEAIANMAAKGYFDPNIESNVYPAAQQDMVISENVAMYINGTWLPNEVAETTPDDFKWGAFAFPEVPNGVEGTECGCYSTYAIAVNKDCDDAATQAAVEFIVYLTTSEWDQEFTNQANAMSRFKFRGAGLIQALIIIGLAIPNIMIVMPLFSVVSALNLSGTHFTLIFLYTACSVPYTTFFLLTFFKGISTSFEEAAAIDGCGPIQCFWKIMFPLAQPAIVTVSIFNFIGKWNEYFMALIFANKSNLRPIGVGLYQTVTSMMNSGDWAGMFASVVIVFVPTVVIYAFLSDKIISGVTAGGNKG